MISSAVTEFKLIGLCSARKGNDLMAETDSEYGIFAAKSLHKLDCFLNILGISGAVGKEYSVGLNRFNFLSRSIPWEYRDAAILVEKRTKNVLLHTEVNCSNMIFRIYGNIFLDERTAYSGNLIVSHDSLLKYLKSFFKSSASIGDKGFSCTNVSDLTDYFSGIYSGNSGNAQFLEGL